MTEPVSDGPTGPSLRLDPRPARAAPGVELLGEFQDSGFEEPPWLARRADGQVVQLPRPLYAVLERLDGRDYEAVAHDVSEDLRLGIDADGVAFLVEEKLAPLGLVGDGAVAAPEGSERASGEADADAVLALRLKTAVVPPGLVRALARPFVPFFRLPVALLVVAGLGALDWWLFFERGVGQATREVLYQPVLMLLLLALAIAGTAFHEVGHAAGAMSAGTKPGVMGVGIYIVWPVFYTDVTDSYGADRAGRLRTDLGGIYFNALFALLVAGLYALTGLEALLLVVVIQHFQALQQLLPLVRLDGYLILSDLTGVPDLFTRIGPTLRSALPGSEDDPRVGELKRRARVVVTAWVFTVVPLLLFVMAMVAVKLPRIVATGWDSFSDRAGAFSSAIGQSELLDASMAGVQMLFLVLPAVGAAVGLTRAVTRMSRGAWRWSDGSLPRRLAVAVTGVALAAGLAWLWWPNGEYEPIEHGERWTVAEGVTEIRSVRSGRPGVVPLDAARTATVTEPAADPAVTGEVTTTTVSPAGDGTTGTTADATTETTADATTETTTAPTPTTAASTDTTEAAP